MTDPTKTASTEPDPEFLAAERELDDSRPITAAELRAFGQEISKGITEGMSALMPKKVSVGDYIRRHAPKVKLRCVVVQNGRQVVSHQLSDEERALANKVHRSGRYLKRRVEVIVHVNPVDEKDRVIDIRYPDAKIDQRLENARYFSDFEDLLKKIVMEQEVAEENEAQQGRGTVPASR